HRAVSLVTGVLEELVIRFAVQRHRHFPGRGEDLRILDRYVVIDCVLVDARETLDGMQLLALRDGADTLRRDIGRYGPLVVVARDVYDEGVAVPAASGVTVPQTKARTEMRAPVDRNHARFVNHLVSRAVARREDPARHATRNAALPRGEVHPVVLNVREPVIAGLLRPRHDRHAAARRFDNK